MNNHVFDISTSGLQLFDWLYVDETGFLMIDENPSERTGSRLSVENPLKTQVIDELSVSETLEQKGVHRPRIRWSGVVPIQLLLKNRECCSDGGVCECIAHRNECCTRRFSQT